MPNHVYNEVRLHGVSLADVDRKLCRRDGVLSFAVLLPLPVNYWPGCVSSAHEAAFPGTQLQAARDTWGTKWDCYGDPSVEQDELDVVIKFQSAWTPPRGWIVALFNILKCQITSLWISEGQEAANREDYTFSGPDNPTWNCRTIQPGSSEHRRLHERLWGVPSFDDAAPAARKGGEQ